MKKYGLLGILFLCIGIMIISLPDNGPRLITFSSAHGPGMMDMVGILLAIGGWLSVSYPVWKQRRKVLSHKGTTSFALILVVLGISYGLIIASVFSDFYNWWLVGIIIQLFIIFLLLYFSLKIKEK